MIQAAPLRTDNTARSILVVDDTLEVLQMICSSLAAAGYIALAAKNAQQALERLELIIPDGILLDALMPGMDGFNLCQHIKQQPAWQHVPIIFMTGLSDSQHIVQGFECGAVDYVVKPLSMPEVLARLATHLNNARTSRLAQEAVDIAGYGIAMLDAQARIAWLSPQAKHWLQIALPDTQQRQQWLKTACLQGEYTCQLQHEQLHARHMALESLGESMLLLSVQTPYPTNTVNRLTALTPREKDVLMWLSKGKTNRDIADILGMSPRTVNKHLEHIFEKLGVETRTAAAALAEYLG